MTPETFVSILKTECRDSAVTSCIASLEAPPGRRPAPDLVALSQWFRSLAESDRRSMESAMRMAADATLFGVLSVIDGVRVVESDPEKSEFTLTATKTGVVSVISPSETLLHDLLRAEP